MRKMNFIFLMRCMITTVLAVLNTAYAGHIQDHFIQIKALTKIQEPKINHCPMVSDIKYKKGRFYANTKYNGISLVWVGDDFFAREHEEIERFVVARAWNHADEDYTVKCYYIVKAMGELTNLEMLFTDYKVTKTSGSNWVQGKECKAEQAEQCEFYIAPRLG